MPDSTEAPVRPGLPHGLVATRLPQFNHELVHLLAASLARQGNSGLAGTFARLKVSPCAADSLSSLRGYEQASIRWDSETGQRHGASDAEISRR